MRTRAGGRAGGGEVIVLNEPVKYLMENDRLLTAPPQATVQAASRLMALHHAGAVLVMHLFAFSQLNWPGTLKATYATPPAATR